MTISPRLLRKLQETLGGEAADGCARRLRGLRDDEEEFGEVGLEIPGRERGIFDTKVDLATLSLKVLLKLWSARSARVASVLDFSIALKRLSTSLRGGTSMAARRWSSEASSSMVR